MAIAGDSNRFLYDSVTPHTFEVSIELLKKGIVLSDLYRKMYEEDLSSLNVTRYVLDNFKVTPNGVAYYILDKDTNNLVICQSNAKDKDIRNLLKVYNYGKTVNPLGYWSGGTNVDCGATNRKLGSDMADSITGGGLHGKDLSKADVSVNIYCFLEAQKLKRAVQAYCAIGDDVVFVDGIPMSFEMIVKVASDYVFGTLGGFEKLAEHGLVR